jgi:serine/threonine-protein kinase RsbW
MKQRLTPSDIVAAPCHIRTPAKLEHLHSLIDMIGDCSKEQGLSDKRINEIRIAAEEALVNIFNYAYQEKVGDVEVACKSEYGRTFVIEITDEGAPFDPLSVAEPNTTLDIDERQIGGMGVFLMKKLMDDLRYRREDNKNILELVVDLTQRKPIQR